MYANYDMLMDDARFQAVGALIDDTMPDRYDPPTIDGVRMSLGCIPRDYKNAPLFANGNEFPDDLLIPEDELVSAWEDQVNRHATLFDLRERSNGYLDSLNQNGFGLCWNFSTTKTNMYARALDGLPNVPLSPWYGAGIINGWRDQGGWCEKSMAFAVKTGCPRLELCPEYKKPSKEKLEQCEADSPNHAVVEFWDTSGDKDKRCHQFLSASIRSYPSADDYNHMSHSMAFCRIVRLKSLYDFDIDMDNSWGMKSGVKGLLRLKGGKARPDSCVIARVSKATNK